MVTNKALVAGGIALVSAAFYVIPKLFKRHLERQWQKEVASLPHDHVVHLYQLRRPTDGFWSVSPPAMKVELFLNCFNIPYKVHEPLVPASRSERFPYIVYDGECIEDSQIIIEKLMEIFPHTRVACQDWLSPEQRSIGLLLRRALEANSYWCFMRLLFVDSAKDVLPNYTVIPVRRGTWLHRQVLGYARTVVITALNTQGNGDWDDTRYHEEWLRDMIAIESVLKTSNKAFLFGDTVSEFDFVVGAFILQYTSQTPRCKTLLDRSPALRFVNESKVLQRYAQNMSQYAPKSF
eukprot:PhF_6_TR37602/c0_g1_i1/m.55838